jgi:5,10-methylene-tetrahydrofolate dehydrogenase/methenyl tetrahydrofolate cyclohydrolase
MLEELKAEVEALQAKHGVVPGLAVVIVGSRKDSQAYVKMKKQAAKQIGYWSAHPHTHAHTHTHTPSLSLSPSLPLRSV